MGCGASAEQQTKRSAPQVPVSAAVPGEQAEDLTIRKLGRSKQAASSERETNSDAGTFLDVAAGTTVEATTRPPTTRVPQDRIAETATPPQQQQHPPVPQPAALNSGAADTDDDFDVKSTGSTTPRMEPVKPRTSIHMPEFTLLQFNDAVRPCTKCGTLQVEYECLQCDIMCCGECVLDVDADHDPTHVLQLRAASGMTGGGGDSSSFLTPRSTNGDGSSTSFLYDPCVICTKTLFDGDVVYRCDACQNFIACKECHASQPPDALHPHPVDRFQRKISTDVKETRKKQKLLDSDGNRCINDYIVVKELGRGAYAKVKLLQHVRTRELFAVKILKRTGSVRKKRWHCSTDPGAPLIACGSGGGGADAAAGASGGHDEVLREVAVMKMMEHKNLVKLIEVIDDEESEKVYVIMEYCKHGCLHRLGDPRLSLEHVRAYGHDVLCGLQHLHRSLLYHRDIKPENVLIGEDGVAKLADFGTCDARDKKLVDGTPAYHAPEMIRGDTTPSGVALDSWAFGVTMFQAAFGVLPFPTNTRQALVDAVLSSEPVAIPTTFSGGEAVDEGLVEILTRLLDKNIKTRAKISDAARYGFFRKRSESFSTSASGSVMSGSGSNNSPGYNRQVPSTDLGDSPTAQQQRAVASGQEPANPTPTTTSSHRGAEPRAVTLLYDKAMTYVRKGRRLHESFYGLEGVQQARSFSMLHGAHRAQNDFPDGTEPSSDGLNASGSTCSSHSQSGLLADVPVTVTSTEDATVEGAWDDVPAFAMPSSKAIKSSPQKASSGGGGSGKGNAEEIVRSLVASRPVHGKLVLDGVPFRVLPQAVAQASDMDHLMLRSNGVVSVASVSFALFSRLREVAIVANSLAEFPLAVLEAKTLRRIDLSGNYLTCLPDALCAHPLLERLSLNDNRIAAIPFATPFTGPHFRHIRLSNNLLNALPRGLEACKSLELVLDDVPKLVDAWTNTLIYQLKNITVVWNDLFPTRVVPSLPLYVATKRVSVYTQNVVQVLNARYVVLPAKSMETFGSPPSHQQMRSLLSTTTSPKSTGSRGSRRAAAAAAKPPPLHSSKFIRKTITAVLGHGGDNVCQFLEECLQAGSEAGAWQQETNEAAVVLCMGDDATAMEVKEITLGVAKLLMRRGVLGLACQTEADAAAFVTRACRGFYS